MSLTTKTAVIVSFLLAATSSWAGHHEKKETSEMLSFRSEPVGDGLYMLIGEGGFTGGNIGISVGDDGLVMIDNAMPKTLGILNQALKKITPRDVDFLINTHLHGDHIGNNESFAQRGAHIVAHEKLRARLKKQGVRGPEGMKPASEDTLPVITFRDQASFYLNGQEARVMHVVNAHTDGDSVIKFFPANVVHAGDVFFHKLFPFIDLDNGGTVDGYIAAQTKILELCDADTKIIPGHGPLATKADLERDLEMLKSSRRQVLALLAKGMSEDDVVKANPLKSFHDDYNWGFITTEKMTRQLYKSLKAAQR